MSIVNYSFLFEPRLDPYQVNTVKQWIDKNILLGCGADFENIRYLYNPTIFSEKGVIKFTSNFIEFIIENVPNGKDLNSLRKPIDELVYMLNIKSSELYVRLQYLP